MALVSPVTKADIPMEIIGPLRRAYNNVSYHSRIYFSSSTRLARSPAAPQARVEQQHVTLLSEASSIPLFINMVWRGSRSVSESS